MSVRQEANGQAHYMRAEFVSMAFGISLGVIQVWNGQSKGVGEVNIKRVKQEG